MMHSTKISQMVPLHWSVILKWATQGPKALWFKNAVALVIILTWYV